MKNILSYFKGDKIIWGVIILLIIVSILSVYSSIATLAFRYKHGNTGYYLFRHLAFVLAGIFALIVTHKMPHGFFYNSHKVILGIAFVLLVITFFGGVSEYGARRWANIGGIQLQTSDVVRFAVIIYISRILSVSQDNEATLLEALKKIMIVVAIACGLILPSNLSTAVLLFGTSLVLMYIGSIPTKYLIRIIGGAIVVAALFVLIAPKNSENVRFGTWSNRISKFIDGDDDMQVKLAKSAIATSNIIGKGPGNSGVKYQLENASSDFIYAIIIEELGTIMGVIVLIAYLVLLFRTVIIVKSISNTFPAFLAIGFSISIVFQALINMSVAVNIIPVTGQPLPLVSLGGTSMVITMASLGIILSISRTIKSEEIDTEIQT